MDTKNKSNLWKIVLAILLVVALCVVPLLLNQDSEFGGADGQAGELIEEIDQDYEPWFDSIWAPPGGETESLLFCLQAALGSGVFFFCLGYLVATKKYKVKG